MATPQFVRFHRRPYGHDRLDRSPPSHPYNRSRSPNDRTTFPPRRRSGSPSGRAFTVHRSLPRSRSRPRRAGADSERAHATNRRSRERCLQPGPSDWRWPEGADWNDSYPQNHDISLRWVSDGYRRPQSHFDNLHCAPHRCRVGPSAPARDIDRRQPAANGVGPHDSIARSWPRNGEQGKFQLHAIRLTTSKLSEFSLWLCRQDSERRAPLEGGNRTRPEGGVGWGEWGVGSGGAITKPV